MFKNRKAWLIVISSLISLVIITALGVRSDLIVLDPKGPVGEIQKDLIIFSLYFMLAIVVIIFAVFTFVIIKYRNRKNFNDRDYDPNLHGSTKLEIIWTLIPLLIVIALSIPNAKALYDLKEAPKSTAHKEPIVIHATAVDWKWIFSYPEEEIETINYVNVPENHPVLFKITAADSMASFWVPQIGGQVYGMPGMVNELYLQADEVGTYEGRNSNFTGEGMAHQQFDFVALNEEEYSSWVEETKETAPKLTEETYQKLMLPETAERTTFSSTHLEFVDHGLNSTYALKVRADHGLIEEPIEDNEEGSHENEHSNHGSHAHH